MSCSISDDRVYKAYYKDVGRKDLLTPQEERSLFQEYKATTDAVRKQEIRTRVVEANLRFVIKVAKKFNQDPELLKELIAAGNEGLLTAIDKYDVERGTRFLTYATHWIKKEIRETLSTQTLVRVPLHRQKQRRKLQKQGIDQPPDVTMTSLADGYERLGVSDFEDLLIHNANSAAVRKLLRELPVKPRDLCIVLLYFGIADEDRRDAPKTLKQISNIVGVTPERVRQIKASVLDQLRVVIVARQSKSGHDLF